MGSEKIPYFGFHFPFSFVLDWLVSFVGSEPEDVGLDGRTVAGAEAVVSESIDVNSEGVDLSGAPGGA